MTTLKRIIESQSATGKTNTFQPATCVQRKPNVVAFSLRQYSTGIVITSKHSPKRSRKVPTRPDILEPTPFLQKFGLRMAQAADGYSVLGVACGTGRNGIFLAQLGIKVVFIVKDLSRLPVDGDELQPLTLTGQRLDLITDPWPFGERTVGGIV